jgi:hypothetical protein
MPPEAQQQIRKRCPTCKEPIEIRGDASFYNKGEKAQLLGDKGQLTAYPPQPAHIYRAAWFYGDRGTRGWGHYYPMYISGPLWYAFRDLDVKGIKLSKMYHTSTHDNPLLQSAQPLQLEATVRPAKTPLPERSAEEWAAIAGLPWDQKDGFIYFELRSNNLAMFDPMMGGEEVAYFEISPGIYRLPVSAIRATEDSGADVDSACLVFIDAAYLGHFVDAFYFEAYHPDKPNEKMLAKVATRIGCRFAICPAEESDCDFDGDGRYTLDLSKLEPVK